MVGLSSGALQGPGPSPLGPGQLLKAGRCQECPVGGVILACRILAFQPRVAEQPLGLRQPQPAGGLAEQPRADSLAAVLAGDVQVADIGPPAVAGQPFSLLDDLHLDVADYLPAQNRRQARPTDADRPVGG